MNNQKQTFIQGTIILLMAGIINRVLGFVPRMALPRVIGAEGVGLYQMGYPLLIALITIVTGGIPIAVAKLVAEAEATGDEQQIRSILRQSFLIIFLASIPLTAAVWLTAPWIATNMLTDGRVQETLWVMSPIIVLVSISSVMRGYFQGRSNMIPTALSQVTETAARSLFVLLLAYVLLPHGIQYAAAGAMGGVLLGEAAGLCVLMIRFHKDRQQHHAAAATLKSADRSSFHRSSRRRLLAISLPITGSKMVGSVSYFLESILIVQSLAAAGIVTAVATAQYGMLQGMVIPILLLPGVLTYSLSVSLIPTLSEAAARRDVQTIHKRLHQTVRLALVTGAPFAVLMFVLAEPICLLLYGDPAPGKLLRWMAPFALFLYIQSPLQATLQALDQPGVALVNTLSGAVLKLVLIIWLAGKLKWGIEGAVIAICLNMALVTVLHWISIRRLTRFAMQFHHFARTLVAMGAMGLIVAILMYKPFPNLLWPETMWIRLVIASGCGLLLYLIATGATGLLTVHDLFRLPRVGPRLQHWWNGRNQAR